MSSVKFIHRGTGYTYEASATLVTTSCGVCGALFAISENFYDWCHEAPHRDFYCPHGHVLHFPGKSMDQKLRDAKDALAAEKARHDQTRASERAQRGAATRARNQRDKLKQRTAHGVCPCCQRTFKQLARHMQTQHPDYVEEQ